MIHKSGFAIAFFFCIVLAGCQGRSPTAAETSATRTLRATASPPSITPTPNTVCTEETPWSPEAGKLATIEFSEMPFQFDPGTDWIAPQMQKGLSFDIYGIYAIDKNMAFLFGGFSVGAGTIRSVLLRTSDGGRQWKQVMPPLNFNDVTHVVFVANGEGWAASSWMLEGMLGTSLWHTTDYGLTWQKIGQLPASLNGGISIFDKKHFQIKTLIWWANPYTDRYAILDSADGGRSWKEVYSVPLNDKNLDAVREAYADTPGGQYGSYYWCPMWKQSCNAYGQDGSQWQVQNFYGKKCIQGRSYDDMLIYAEVRRLFPEPNSTYVIPVDYSVQEDKLSVTP